MTKPYEVRWKSDWEETWHSSRHGDMILALAKVNRVAGANLGCAVELWNDGLRILTYGVPVWEKSGKLAQGAQRQKKEAK